MALSTFGVVHGDIKASKFPSLADFSSTTKPTSTTVGSFVNRAAADLVGRLAIKGVTAADIDSSGEPAASAAGSRLINRWYSFFAKLAVSHINIPLLYLQL